MSILGANARHRRYSGNQIVGWNGTIKAIEVGGPIAAILAIGFGVFGLAIRYGLFPKFSRDHAFIIWILFCVTLVLSLLLFSLVPVVEKFVLREENIALILVTEEGATIQRSFSMQYRVPGRAAVPVDGVDGVAEARDIPRSASSLDVISVSCPGYQLAQSGLFEILDQTIRIPMMREDPTPPMGHDARPDPGPFRPNQEELDRSPDAEPSSVTFQYRNNTGRALTLSLYSYSEPHEDAWRLQKQWSDFPMPDGQLRWYDKFKGGSGWYGFWVMDSQGRYWSLGAMNIYAASLLRMTVTLSGDNDRPYEASLEVIEER